MSADAGNPAALGMAWVREVDVSDLVPGDIVILDTVTIPADMVLLQVGVLVPLF